MTDTLVVSQSSRFVEKVAGPSSPHKTQATLPGLDQPIVSCWSKMEIKMQELEFVFF